LQSAPWKDHLFTIEPTLEHKNPILYVLYPEHSDDPSSKWRIQCVPESPDSFINRRSLPEAWRGVRDADLSKVSGIPGECEVERCEVERCEVERRCMGDVFAKAAIGRSAFAYRVGPSPHHRLRHGFCFSY
jgi:hypothetical protein